MTVMIIAKDAGTDYNVTVDLQNFVGAGAVKQYRLDSLNNLGPQADLAVAGTQVVLSVPAQSITLLVINGQYQDAPTNFSATYKANGCAGNYLSWTGKAGVNGTPSYEIFRRNGVSSFPVAPTLTITNTSICDDGVALGTNIAYLYEVRAVSGGVKSGMSNVDATTTTDFSNDPLSAGTTILLAHITELRTAIDAMRTTAGIGTGTYSPITVRSTKIQAEHINELRRQLNQARAWLGLTPPVYTDPALTSTTGVKRNHIDDLRNAVK